VAATAAVAAVRFSVRGVLGDTAPLLPVVMAVMVAAWYGGLRPGLLATATSVVAGNYLFVPPILSLRIALPEVTGVAIFLITGITISWMCESLHAARRDAVEERRRAEATAGFLAVLERSLRQASDPVTIEREATRLLGEHLGTDRCFFNEIDLDAGTARVLRAWEDSPEASAVRSYRLADFVTPELLAAHARGETVVVDDVMRDPRTDGAVFAAAGFRAFIAAP
jgi:K+-sensing histidine kinase KdpD